MYLGPLHTSIVFGFLCLVMGILVWLGIRKVKKVKAPERTISETRGDRRVPSEPDATYIVTA